jgi:hypothetical protein
VDDDDRDDRRRKRSVGLHGGARLPAGSDTRPSRMCDVSNLLAKVSTLRYS